jgi:hypothetical protein
MRPLARLRLTLRIAWRHALADWREASLLTEALVLVLAWHHPWRTLAECVLLPGGMLALASLAWAHRIVRDELRALEALEPMPRQPAPAKQGSAALDRLVKLG